MIDPSDVTKFTRTTAELEEFWLFSLLVAGKTAVSQAKALDRFLPHPPTLEAPFDWIRRLRDSKRLLRRMKQARIGQYNRLQKAFLGSLSLDLHNDPVTAFEAVHGVGPKTARFFLLHSRQNQPLAALDTHILAELQARGYDVPKVTPSTLSTYRKWEAVVLQEAAKDGQSPADWDLAIWNARSRKVAA